MTSVLFVCTGNICRSPMAEAMLRHMLQKADRTDVDVFSRGVAAEVGHSMTPFALDALQAHGIDGSKHRAAALTVADMKRADLVLVMEKGHLLNLNHRYRGIDKKTFMLKTYGDVFPGDSVEIADPYGLSPEEYEKCRMEIQDSLLGVFPKLK
jgi:protein-tyrosine-phosphatase